METLALLCRIEIHLEVLVHAVRGNPVGVEDAQVAAALANTLLSDGAKVAAELELVDTLGLGLSVDDTLVDGPLPVTTPDTHTEDDEALLGLVTEPAINSMYLSFCANGIFAATSGIRKQMLVRKQTHTYRPSINQTVYVLNSNPAVALGKHASCVISTSRASCNSRNFCVSLRDFARLPHDTPVYLPHLLVLCSHFAGCCSVHQSQPLNCEALICRKPTCEPCPGG
jgi:hypothetical protein